MSPYSWIERAKWPSSQARAAAICRRSRSLALADRASPASTLCLSIGSTAPSPAVIIIPARKAWPITKPGSSARAWSITVSGSP
jgi:hypothetical protein